MSITNTKLQLLQTSYLYTTTTNHQMKINHPITHDNIPYTHTHTTQKHCQHTHTPRPTSTPPQFKPCVYTNIQQLRGCVLVVCVCVRAFCPLLQPARIIYVTVSLGYTAAR